MLTSADGRMRVLVVEKQPQVRTALHFLLERHPDVIVAGVVSDFESLAIAMDATSPDLLLLGWGPNGQTGEECLQFLQKNHSRAKVIVLSCQQGIEIAALTAGADFFVSKADPPERLLEALTEVHRELLRESEISLDVRI